MKLEMKRILILQIVTFAFCAYGESVLSQNRPYTQSDAYRVAKAFEVKPLPAEPRWAEISQKPFFTFIWMSDLHLDGSRLEFIQRAFRLADSYKPDFVVFTGDNNAYAPGKEVDGVVPPVTLQRQLFFKEYLKENLASPAVVIPGDDWPPDFEKVFGAFQFSFNYGGLHFVMFAADRCAYGVEGCAVYEDSTWRWLDGDLARNAERPTIFFQHETMLPPAYLDADKMRRKLEGSGNVFAAFCGHIHVDLDFSQNGIRHLVCPALGPNPAPAFKLVHVHQSAIILRTIEYDPVGQTFIETMKWQRIEIPNRLRGAMHFPPDGGFKKEDYCEIPAHPRASDPALLNRGAELFGPMMRFTATHGLSKLNSK